MDKDIVISFVEAINNHDTDKIVNLMAEDYIFIDSYREKHVGKKGEKQGWKGYFALFPDFKIEIEDMAENDSIFGLFGYASATYKNLKDESNSNFWKIQASWKAIVENKKIKHWQIYCDVKIVLEIIERNNKAQANKFNFSDTIQL